MKWCIIQSVYNTLTLNTQTNAIYSNINMHGTANICVYMCTTELPHSWTGLYSLPFIFIPSLSSFLLLFLSCILSGANLFVSLFQSHFFRIFSKFRIKTMIERPRKRVSYGANFAMVYLYVCACVCLYMDYVSEKEKTMKSWNNNKKKKPKIDKNYHNFCCL